MGIQSDCFFLCLASRAAVQGQLFKWNSGCAAPDKIPVEPSKFGSDRPGEESFTTEFVRKICGAPGEIRTPGLLVRSKL